MAVVDGLEFVEVEIDQRRGRPIALDVGQRAGKRALKTPAIERLRQRIDVDSILQFADAQARGRKLCRKPLDLGGKPRCGRARARLWRFRLLVLDLGLGRFARR